MFIKKIEDNLGISIISLFLLSLLGVPRLILHDLSLIEEGTFTNRLFVFVPIVIWISYIVWKNVKHPFLSLLVVGIFYGIFLAVGHQLLWDTVFDTPIQLRENLSNLPPIFVNILFRFSSIFSSLLTGVFVGSVSGMLASAIYWIKRILPESKT